MAFLGRGFFVRGVGGVASHAPAEARDPLRAGGVDDDVRMRTDRLASQGLFLGLRVVGYMKGKTSP